MILRWFLPDGSTAIFCAAQQQGKKKTRAEPPPYGRGVRGLCIIDEALYRQTKLNTETLAALPQRTVVGGWVGVGEVRGRE